MVDAQVRNTAMNAADHGSFLQFDDCHCCRARWHHSRWELHNVVYEYTSPLPLNV